MRVRKSWFLAALCAVLILGSPIRAFADVPLPSPTRTWSSPGHTRYYVDSVSGSDTNDGKSARRAWQTLAKVNGGNFAPGDWILLKSGSHWDTYFCPGGSGGYRHPVKVTSYGDGLLPSIDAHGQTLATVSLQNASYWDIENLDVTNTSNGTFPQLRGVEVNLYNYGTAHDIVLKNLSVHDIASPEDKGNGGSGIYCDNRGDIVKSRFDGLLIEGCHLVHTDRNGITMDTGYWERPKWYPNLNVVFRNNLLENIGGDCIVAMGCDGAVLEHNAVHGGRMRAPDWASGIWVFSCDNSLIQYNEIDGMHGQMDAQGFDADWNTQNTVIQYNYSHNNEGGFAMACDNGDVKPPVNVGNDGTIIRYNVSQDDGYRTFTFSGPDTNVQVYNNDIYVNKGINTILFFTWNWGNQWPDHVTLSNNIFDVLGQGVLQPNATTNVVFDHNDWFGNIVSPPTDNNLFAVDPLFQNPGFATNDRHSLDGYFLAKNSPCRKAGVIVPDNGERNFWGKTVRQGRTPNIGAG